MMLLSKAYSRADKNGKQRGIRLVGLTLGFAETGANSKLEAKQMMLPTL